jgi:uncharacterized membrane protein
LGRVSIFLAVLFALTFPLTIWLAEGQVEPRWLAVMLLFGGLLRLFRQARWWIGGLLLLVVPAFWANVMFPLKLYPVVVNASLLGVFAYSLIAPPSAVERIARLRDAQLPAAAIRYTRRVTQVWCVFFGFNGAIALYTAVYMSSAHWSFYNGFLAYVLIGLLFAGEYCVRQRVMGHHRG